MGRERGGIFYGDFSCPCEGEELKCVQVFCRFVAVKPAKVGRVIKPPVFV